MLAFDTAVASFRESSKMVMDLEFEEPHLVHEVELSILQPNECPQTHLRNCHSSLTKFANNAGSSLCRGKDELLNPLRDRYENAEMGCTGLFHNACTNLTDNHDRRADDNSRGLGNAPASSSSSGFCCDRRE